MKHVLVTNGRNWLHNVYTIEKGQEWLKKHPDRKDAYIYADHQWFYRSDTDRYSNILNHEQGDLVAAIKANVPPSPQESRLPWPYPDFLDAA